MSEWITVGDSILNISNIEYVERKSSTKIVVYMCSGKIIELTNTVSVTLWQYLDSERLKFLDLENPKRDFSGT